MVGANRALKSYTIVNRVLISRHSVIQATSTERLIEDIIFADVIGHIAIVLFLDQSCHLEAAQD